MEPIIQIKNVTKTFIGKDNQVEALKGISLDINKGDIYGIIGMSGAGKSTLVRCLNYLEKPTTGTVVVEDQDLSTLTEAELRKVRTGIAMIFQHFNLLMQRSVLDNVCFPMEIVGVKKQAARKRAMELLEIVGYTENEKEHIAKEHLIPKQMEENGIEKGKLTIQSAALKKIINNYTKEAGVRNLERTIGQICRKTARLIMEEDKKKVTVTSKNLSDFLGKEHFNYLMANKKDEIGISRGLAWTQVGGDTLQIEVNVMPGKGELMLTGQLGDVMKESAQAGITYIRSIASDYKVEPEFFQENDIHVHIPEGAVPKDGPSAGITMATAILSAIIKKPVRADLAMTGEITLRGRVLPIGGLKEKLLAAKYAKIKEVLVPAENKPDIQELDKEITDGLTITFVSSMKEVLNKALV